MGRNDSGGEPVSRNVSEPDSASIGKRRWPVRRLGWSQTPLGKQQAQATSGPSGVVGDSARGKISRGAWEALPGGSVSDQRAEGRHNWGGGRAGSRRGP